MRDGIVTTRLRGRSTLCTMRPSQEPVAAIRRTVRSRLLHLLLGISEPTGPHILERPKRPPQLIYSVGEMPPTASTIALGFQHVFVISVGWIFVVVLVTAIGGTTAQAQGMIRVSMIASGIATILQARVSGRVGSGYMCPFSCGPAYLSASILAGKAGGLPLVFGLTAAVGLFEGLLSQLVQRLRVLFPPEVTGLVVCMVGIELIGLGCPRFLGYAHGQLDKRATVVACITLAIMIGPSIWSKGRLRLYPILLGLFAGYTASAMLGLFSSAQARTAFAAPLVSLPTPVTGGGLGFSIALLFPFLIASLSSTLKSVGDLTLCQKINDANWKRTDMKSVSGGILAGAICTTLAGLGGGMGQSTFSSNVGLTIATGATSRVIALPTGLFVIALAFFPKLAAIFSIMPAPVIGAVLVYVACFMIVGGLQVITSRMLDVRRTFVVGIPLIFGLSVEMVPGLYRQVPNSVSPLFSSGLALATVLAVTLNLLFRLGVAKCKTAHLVPDDTGNFDEITCLVREQGAAWGMRSEVATRAIEAIHEFMIAARQHGVLTPILVQLRFDEFNLEADLEYDGEPIEIPSAPPSVEMLGISPESAMASIAAYLVRRSTDGLSIRSTPGHCHVHLHFQH
jgi:xanthine permease XanP